MSSQAIVPKEDLIKSAEKELKKKSYSVYNYYFQDIEFCFELFAKAPYRNIPNLMLKFCENIDRIKPDILQELKLLSRIISAIPLLIGQKNRRDALKDDIIYERNDLFILNNGTLKKLIHNPSYPTAIAKRGGYYHEIDGKKLKKLRSEKNLSQAELGKKIGVSRKSISGYENKGMRSSIENAKKMKEIFEQSVVQTIDFFRCIQEKLEESLELFKINLKYQQKHAKESKEFAKMITEIVDRTGFKTYWSSSTPLDIFIYQDNEDSHEIQNIMFFGGTNYQGKADNRQNAQEHFIKSQINQMKGTGIIYEDNVFDVKEVKRKHLPYLLPEELKLLENPKEFQKLILKRLKKFYD